MNYWLLLFPLIAAALGWLANRLFLQLLFHPQKPTRFLGITLHGVIPKRKTQLAPLLGNIIKKDLFSFKEITTAISSPANLEKLTPLVEIHIDKFLNEKLATEMPMLSMFISEKTIGKLKAVFMSELTEMFPFLIQQYAANLEKELDLEKMISQKMTAFSTDRLEKILKESLKREFRSIEILGGAVGFLIGILLLVITAFTS